jgi:hypothetical protein
MIAAGARAKDSAAIALTTHLAKRGDFMKRCDLMNDPTASTSYVFRAVDAYHRPMGLKTTRFACAAAGVAASVLLAMAPAAVAAPGTHASTDQMKAFFIKLLVDRGVPYTSADDAVKLAQSTCGILSSASPTRIQDAATAIQGSVT